MHPVVGHAGLFPENYHLKGGRLGEELLAKLVADYAIANHNDGSQPRRPLLPRGLYLASPWVACGGQGFFTQRESMKSTLLLLTGLTFSGCRPPGDETAAIKRVLEEESASWRAGDVATHAACWHLQPYSRVLVSTPEGKTFDVPPTAMVTASPDMGQGGAAVNTNYHIQVAGDRAWVSHDEVSTAKNARKSYSHEIRLLEKIEGQWKLVAQSIHVYNP